MKVLNGQLHMKVDQMSMDEFESICKNRYSRKHTDMLREIITAFNEGRVTIMPSKAQQKLMGESK